MWCERHAQGVVPGVKTAPVSSARRLQDHSLEDDEETITYGPGGPLT
jgi:hypothetical protein